MIHPLPFTANDLGAYARQIGAPDVDCGAESLARAIACSPGWSRIPGCSVLLRQSPAALAIVGHLDAPQRAELRAQADAARSRLYSFRYVSYADAELACSTLASRLRPLLRDPEWAGCRYRAIPNGGHLVLAMLATVLSLSHQQLHAASDPDLPVVLVDDCILTGVRLREQMGQCREKKVIAAHLFSHPALRDAARKAEPRLVACVAASDLDSGPEPESAATLSTSLGNRGYWRGRTELVAFAWNEPDRTVVGSGIPEPLEGWKLIPPELCLKNRQLPSIPVLFQRTGLGATRPASNVLFQESELTVTLTLVGGGEVVELRGAAAAAWKALLDTGDTGHAEARLAQDYEVSTAQLRSDLHGVWADLRNRKFLECSED